ncbi:MAG: hypothetical protein FWC46_10065 [Actinomycetia bacterium]|nr:hypothetical protein [Actinomycetes bacterium]
MTIFLAGGEPAAPYQQAHDRFADEARARGTRVAVAVEGDQDGAAELVPAYAEPVLRRWPEAQIEPVRLVGADTVWPDDAESFAGIVVAGEHTSTVLESLRPVRPVLARLIRQGVPYFGYSAGVSAVARHAILGGWRHHGRQIAPEAASEGLDELALADGLGLIGVTTQAHGDVAGLLDRAVTALLVGPTIAVVVLDEGVCLAVSSVSGATRGFGEGRLAWLARHGDQVIIRAERVGAHPNEALPHLAV